MEEYIFIKGYDSVDGDVKRVDLKEAIPEEMLNLPCFNTLGFFKHTINELKPSQYFGENDGIFVKNILSQFPIKVVNLDRRPDRWERTKKMLDEQFITNYERFSAIDGTKMEMTPAIKHLFRGNDFNYRQGFVGCALSHIKLWNQLIRDESTDYYIIMEDDVELVSDFKNKLNIALHQITQKPFIDLHYLGYFYWKGEPIKSNNYPILSNMDIKSYMGGTWGYIISKSGAFKLLNISKYYGIQNGIDRFMNIHFDKMIVSNSEPHLLHSEYVIPGKNVDSDIQGNGVPIGVKNEVSKAPVPKKIENSFVSKNIKVKLISESDTSKNLVKSFSKMTENNQNRWKDILITDSNEADYFVILNKPRVGEYYNPFKTLYFQTNNLDSKNWGKWSNPDKMKLYKIFTNKNHFTPAIWNISPSYSDIINTEYIKKQNLFSLIFDKMELSVKDKLNKFNEFLKSKNLSFSSFDDSSFNENVYTKYKYMICIEDVNENNYINRLYDGILSECLCFYHGCSNIEDYIDSKAFIRIDLNDFESSYNTILKSIESDEYKKRIDVIRTEKVKIANKMNLLNVINDNIGNFVSKEVSLKSTKKSENSKTKEIITYIFSWKRVSENARNVFDEIRKVHKNTYIINCDEKFKMERNNVIEADDTYWYSKQFFTCLKHCKENHPDCYYMSLTGDVSPEADWKNIIERSKFAIENYNAGISAPNVDFTCHTSKNQHFKDNFWYVPNTDCTIWTIHPDVYNLILTTDFEKYSKIGHGIDILASEFTKMVGKIILRDYSNTVLHPKDRGYGAEASEELSIVIEKIYNKWLKIKNKITPKIHAGLGNQFFMIANAYAVAKDNDKELIINDSYFGTRKTYWNTIFKNFKTQKLDFKDYKLFQEKFFNYQKIEIENDTNIILEGYFQSENYFEKYKDEIKELFKLPEDLENFSKDKISSYKFKNEICAVHIRRGDYVDHVLHNILPIEYYKKAINFIKEHTKVDLLFFTDDKKWVSDNFENATIVKCDEDYQELAVMQQCHHFIMANSSFSWWASYLSKNSNKIVVAPKQWFNNNSLDWKDVYCTDWIVM